MKKILKLVGKIFIGILGVILALVIFVIGGLNIAKFAIYSDYYSMETNICTNPGLNDGFVCQGIAISEANEKIIVSGYMADDSASRLYVTDYESNSYYVTLAKNGEDFTGHAGGVAISGDAVYLANGQRIYTISLKDVLNAENGAALDVGEGVPVNNSASFVFADETYLYVGEFHDGGKYVTDHPYETPDGLYHAIVSRYTLDNLTQPDKIYSIRDKVQGICFTPDGQVVLSTSYGLSDTMYYVYNEQDAVDSGEMLDGAPVYYLNNCIKEVKGPAMGEDLDYYDGNVITLTESASNKYIFGKLFFANKVVALDILNKSE